MQARFPNFETLPGTPARLPARAASAKRPRVPGPRFELTLEIQPDPDLPGGDPDASQRLGQFLKVALRAWKIKCLAARRLPNSP